jgi:hypothetical protein
MFAAVIQLDLEMPSRRWTAISGEQGKTEGPYHDYHIISSSHIPPDTVLGGVLLVQVARGI